MVRIEEPIELTAAPVHVRDQPCLERGENQLEPLGGARAKIAALQARDHRVAAPRPASQLRLRPIPPMPQRPNRTADPLPIHASDPRRRRLRTPYQARTIAGVSDFIGETTNLLRRTPDLLRALLIGLPDAWTDTTDVPENGWRPRDVVGHLITGELTDWIERTERILEHGTSVPFDRFDRFAHAERDTDATLDELVEHFARLRAENLARLAELATDADLDRRGMHPSLGEVTLRELLATWAVHDLDHVSQIFASMAGSHDAEVGPWKAYLGILLRREDPAAIPG